MSFDINEYKDPNDTEKVWQMKKLFIEKYHDKFDEKRLVCLAQCYVNIETLGCSYSREIMNQIKELTSGFQSILKEQENQQFSSNIKPKTTQINKAPINNNNNNKHKLINKSKLQYKFEQEKSKQVQILSRNQADKSDLSSFFKPASTNPPVSLIDLIRNTPAATAAPITTTEMAPAPSLLPIPFGLTTQQQQQQQANNKPASRRNVLLESISSQKQDPIAMLLNGTLKQPASAPVVTADEFNLFARLNKINKLREVLRCNMHVNKYSNDDLIAYFEAVCMENSVELRFYSQFNDSANMYIGEMFIESIRLMSDQAIKKKKCRYYVYRNGLNLLCSQCELAVKMINNKSAGDVLLNYELYRIDSDCGVVKSASNKNICALNNNTKNQMPSILNELFNKANENKSTESIQDLNQMLKSMILPKESILKLNNNSNNDSKDENDDDDFDDKTQQSLDKKTKIKQNLVNFCLFLPATPSDIVIDLNNIDYFLHEKSSIQILSNSCAKSNCNLEFELKLKSANTSSSSGNSSKYTKTILSGDNIQSGSEDEPELSNDQSTTNFKCKCLINGIKIASSHSKTKSDAKRLVALKALKFLFKIFPTFKVTKETYSPKSTDQNKFDSIDTQPRVTEAKYFKITKEDLFKGILPANLLQNNQNQEQPQTKMSNLGWDMLKKMGWKEGKGLGKMEQGPEEPLDLDRNFRRLGLGFNNINLDQKQSEPAPIDPRELNWKNKEDRNNYLTSVKLNKMNTKMCTNEKSSLINNVVSLFNAYENSPSKQDLVFDNRFTSDQRKIIHREANRFGLKSQSQGKGTERFLVIRRKDNINEIVRSVLEDDRDEAGNYKLISKGDL